MCWLQQSVQLWYYPTFLLYPLVVIACVECFAGYHAWRFLIGLNGGIIGFVVGAVACLMLSIPLLSPLAAFAGVIAGVALFAGIVPVGSCVFAWGSVTSLTLLLGRFGGVPVNWLYPVAAAAGTAGAFAAMTVRRPAMIALTAVAGAHQIVSAWHARSFSSDSIPLPDVNDPAEWAAVIVLAAAGLLIQFTTSRTPHASQPTQTPASHHHRHRASRHGG